MEHGSATRLPVRAHRQWTPLARALAATGDRWTLLIALALSHETLRLSVLRKRLPGVSSGVLDHHLTQMVALGLLSRERFREMPPRVELTLTERGSELLPIAAALARWGMRHEWPMPDGREYIHAAAIIRQLPALLEERTDLPEGTIEAIVGDDDESIVNLFQVVAGRLQSAAESVEQTTARVEGDEAAWIDALGPARDYSRLRFIGERKIAERILDALPRDVRT
jgi:DNA-binding HxlR family transcriptional regulator